MLFALAQQMGLLGPGMPGTSKRYGFEFTLVINFSETKKYIIVPKCDNCCIYQTWKSKLLPDSDIHILDNVTNLVTDIHQEFKIKLH